MGKFSLDLKASPKHVVEYNGFEVTVQPLDKKEDIELVRRHTEGKVKVLQGQKKKGFRAKEKDELLIPEVDYFALNLERAKLTWKDWNIESSVGVKEECNSTNIEALFNRYYSELAEPILERYDDIVAEYNREIEKEGKN